MDFVKINKDMTELKNISNGISEALANQVELMYNVINDYQGKLVVLSRDLECVGVDEEGVTVDLDYNAKQIEGMVNTCGSLMQTLTEMGGKVNILRNKAAVWNKI